LEEIGTLKLKKFASNVKIFFQNVDIIAIFAKFVLSSTIIIVLGLTIV